ncbi:hypothetical protein EGW08_016073 [Elysia chlorotica]|uniref:Uncharacterized protein n=1 Tax=Elysia chlorotica TaxID=188477 RepID=A0A3S1HBU2_ELYCH|nr:hypothetical protein EGW08_016073 [Elysia chlorotica]
MSPARDNAPSERDASSSSTNVNEPANSAVCGDALASGTNVCSRQGDGKGKGGEAAAGASLCKPEANGRDGGGGAKKDAAGGAGDPSGPAAAEAKRRRYNQLGRHHTMGDPTDTSELAPDSSDQSSTDGGRPSSTVSRRRQARLEAMTQAKSMDAGHHSEHGRPGEFEPEETPRSVLDRPIPRQRTESKGEPPVTARRRRREKYNRDKTPPLGQHPQKPSESSFDEDVFDTPISGKVGDIVAGGAGGLAQLNSSASEFVPRPFQRQPDADVQDDEKKREKQLQEEEEEKQLETKRHQNVSLTLSNMRFPGRAEPISLPSPVTQETQTMTTRIFLEKSTQTPDNFYPPIPTQDKAIDANQFVDAATITSTWSFDSHADLSLDLEEDHLASKATPSGGPQDQKDVTTPAPTSPKQQEEEAVSGVAVSRIFPTPLSFSAHVTVTPPGSVPGSVPGTPPSSSKPGVAGFPTAGGVGGVVHQHSVGSATVASKHGGGLYPQSLSMDSGLAVNVESPVVVLPLPVGGGKVLDVAPQVTAPPLASPVSPMSPVAASVPSQAAEAGNEAVLPKLEKARARRRRRMDRKKKVDSDTADIQNENVPVGDAVSGAAPNQTKPTATPTAAVKKNSAKQQLNSVSASDNVPGSPTLRTVSLESNEDVFVLASDGADGNAR